MTTFQDGPAKGQTLMIRRAPIYLRVVEKDGKFDALDQIDDTPAAGETIHVYKLTGKPGHIHLNTGRKPGGGFYPMATYAHIPETLAQDELRETATWRDWCQTQHDTQNPPL